MRGGPGNARGASSLKQAFFAAPTGCAPEPEGWRLARCGKELLLALRVLSLALSHRREDVGIFLNDRDMRAGARSRRRLTARGASARVCSSRHLPLMAPAHAWDDQPTIAESREHAG